MAVKKKRSLSPSFTLFLLCFAAFILIASIVFAIFAIDINRSSQKEYPFTVYLKQGEKRILTLEEDDAISKDGTILISPEVLSSYCSFGIYGDDNTKTLVFKDESYARFTPGNSFEIDGESKFLTSGCVKKDSKFYIPLEFYENFVDGIIVEKADTGKKLVIDIKVNVDNYSVISHGASPLDRIDEKDYFDTVYVTQTPEKKFKTDLTPYKDYIEPKNRDKYLFLVNSENTLTQDYLPEKLTDLVHTRKDGRATQKMDLYAAKAMEAMLNEAHANGYTSLSITSGYRSYAYQQQLFDNQVSALTPSYGDKARQKAAEAVALPGTSEHQSGLCCDLHNLPAANQSFANTEEYTWLLNNCAEFGFILRYPKDKTEITGIMFEPWHYRYVGRYHARIIMGEGLCLEEYMERIQ